jgi:peroxiredoxin
LYISLDEKENNWRKAIAQYHIEGLHMRDNIKGETNVSHTYGAGSIPSTFIIDRKGNFHTIQPPPPSKNNGKNLIKVLEAALAK